VQQWETCNNQEHGITGTIASWREYRYIIERI